MAFQGDLSQTNRDYILAISNDIGIAVNTAQARTIMHDLFEETQQQAEELEAQQEEMRVTNEELINKTQMLEASEEELKAGTAGGTAQHQCRTGRKSRLAGRKKPGN